MVQGGVPVMAASRLKITCLALPPGAESKPFLERAVDALGGLGEHVFRHARVLIKPNFVGPFPLATTDLGFVEFFVHAVRELGGLPIIGESSGFEFDTRTSMKLLGVHALADRLEVPLLPLDEASHESVDLGAPVGRVELAGAAHAADLIINLPVLKGHAVTSMTGAVKNSFGLLSKTSRRRLHARGLHQGIARLARHLAPKSIHVVDARYKLARAAFADAEPLGYLLAGRDPFALDHFGCGLLGVHPTAVKHLEDLADYAVEGDPVHVRPMPSGIDPIRLRLRRAAYAASYAMDHAQARALGTPSILPFLHWHLGVHPELLPGAAGEALARVARSCPVDAIDVVGRRIRASVCRSVRCLACHRAHPDLVRLAGLNPPARP